MRCKDSVEIFNIVVNLEGCDADNSGAVIDPNGILSFWNLVTDVECSLNLCGFVVDSVEYHEYDPSMLLIVKTHMYENSDYKIELRFRVSDITEKLLSMESSQKHWRSQFEDELLDDEYFVGSCIDYITINNKQFNFYSSSIDYFMNQIENLK